MPLNLIETTGSYFDYDCGIAFFNHDTTQIVYDTGKIRKYDLATGDLLSTFDYAEKITNSTIHDGTRFVLVDYATAADYGMFTDTYEDVVIVLDFTNDLLVYKWTTTGYVDSEYNKYNTISEDGTRIAFFADSSFLVIDIDTDTVVYDSMADLGNISGRPCKMSKDGSMAVYGSSIDNSYKTVDLSTGTIVNSRIEPSGERITAISLNYDGSIVSTGYYDSYVDGGDNNTYVDTWYSVTGSLIDSFQTNTIAIATDRLALSPNAERAAVLFEGADWYGDIYHAQTGSYSKQVGYDWREDLRQPCVSNDNSRILIPQEYVNRINLYDITSSSTVELDAFKAYDYIRLDRIDVDESASKLVAVDYYGAYVYDIDTWTRTAISEELADDAREMSGTDGRPDVDACDLYDNGNKCVIAGSKSTWDNTITWAFAFDTNTGDYLFDMSFPSDTVFYGDFYLDEANGEYIATRTDYLDRFDLNNGSYIGRVDFPIDIYYDFVGYDIGGSVMYYEKTLETATSVVARYDIATATFQDDYLPLGAEWFSLACGFPDVNRLLINWTDSSYDDFISVYTLDTLTLINTVSSPYDYDYAGRITDNLVFLVYGSYYLVIDINDVTILDDGMEYIIKDGAVVSGFNCYSINDDRRSIDKLEIDLGTPTLEIYDPTNLIKQV